MATNYSVKLKIKNDEDAAAMAAVFSMNGYWVRVEKPEADAPSRYQKYTLELKLSEDEVEMDT
jgi:hypothetical protein